MGIGKVVEWWDGLDDTAQNCFLIAGLLMVAVVGLTVGIVAAVNVAAVVALEPLMHIGFAVCVASLLATMGTAVVRL